MQKSGTGGVSGPAFVAGATGYTGREVVRALVGKGVRTVAHVRPDSARLDEWKRRFGDVGAEVDTTAWDESSMAETMMRLRPAYVFAMLGTVRARMKLAAAEGRDPGAESYEAVDYGLTAMLIGAALSAEIRPRFVYLSAMGAQGKNPSSYFKARRKAENELTSSGLPFTIARPSFITGPDRDDDRPGERIGAAVSDAALSFISIFDGGKLKAKFGAITNADLADALVRLALDPAAENKIFEADKLRRHKA